MLGIFESSYAEIFVIKNALFRKEKEKISFKKEEMLIKLLTIIIPDVSF